MKRPFGVTIIGVLLLVQGLLLVVLALTITFLTPAAGADDVRPLLAVNFPGLTPSGGFSAMLLGVFGAFLIVSGIEVLRLRPWARLAATVLQGWALGVFLLGYFTRGQSNYPTVLLSVAIVFYLNSRTVRHAFDLARDREAGAVAGAPAASRSTIATKAEAASRGNGSSWSTLWHMDDTAEAAPVEGPDAGNQLTTDDLALLRRYEPVLCFNIGEQFYPMDVDRFIESARLCVQQPDMEAEEVVPQGRLDAASLGHMLRADVPGAVTFLAVAEPLTAAQVRDFRKSSSLKDFHVGPGRLVRVGLAARFVDLFFSLSLLLRGKAPGGLAAGGAVRYQALQAQQERYTYYGRVVREHGYIVLQYWFFYAYNDWRSSFHGVNDHEGDWEMITVYAAQNGSDAVEPCWIACSAHDSDGDDLRRRWDDPDLERVGEHPVMYVGAGSHAHYFIRGEYMPAVVVPHTQGIARFSMGLRRLWAWLGQGDEPNEREGEGFRIPFVEYARGDGMHLGPTQRHEWDVHLLQATATAPAPAWVDGYTGLWGLYSGDPLGGENGPPGPRYERDGLQRKRWYDPVGWCGLDKVPPPPRTVAALAEQQRRLSAEEAALTTQIQEQASLLAGLELEVAAMRGVSAERRRNVDLQRQLRAVNADLERSKAARAANEIAQERCAVLASQVAMGDFGDPRAHLIRPPLPTSPADLRLGRLAGMWSAISVGTLLLGFATLALFTGFLGLGIVALLGIYGFFEALFHRDVQVWLARLVVALAVVTTLVLLVQFFEPVALGAVVLVGLFIIVDNVREILA